MPHSIKAFNEYVLRTPAFPVHRYLRLLENYSTTAVLQEFDNPYCREALRMASPELLAEVDKWKTNPHLLNPSKKEAIAMSLLKYSARMATRCTPFGLFAGCSVGKLDMATKITLQEYTTQERFTQFDMHFWVALLQNLAQRKEVRQGLLYYPNSSLYSLGDYYRFIEYHYVNGKRQHSITALKHTEVLGLLYHEAKKGITIAEMVSLIADDDTEVEEATTFIEELIAFQFLVSHLEATVTGHDEGQRVLDLLAVNPAVANEYRLLQNLETNLKQLDKNVVPTADVYQKIKKYIDETKVTVDEKYLFQTDYNAQTTTNSLDQQHVKKVTQALSFLNGIQPKSSSSHLIQFASAFTQRYESRSMPLTTVLDTETGIGYLSISSQNDTHDILDSFSFNGHGQTEETIQESWHPNDYILQKKRQEAIDKNQRIIQLSKKDFPHFNDSLQEAPATFSVMVEVFKSNAQEMIVIESSGGVSAAKLLGRFCNGNQDIHELTQVIVSKETTWHQDKILAEIVHIPESRTGNILRRPVLRAYEIAYLCQAGVAPENTISMSDLQISVVANYVRLWSEKHQKEVVPCLSNAHNYGRNSLPIYHFLCDLQAQNIKPIYSFNWGVLESHYDYFPRVMNQEVVLAKAKWIVHKIELELFHKLTGSPLKEAFDHWRDHRGIPRYTNWVQFDNTLLLDFEKEVGVTLFIKSTSQLPRIVLEEFLFVEDSPVKDVNEAHYANQVVLSFYKE
jgi:lantibiotic biosynthesis protein